MRDHLQYLKEVDQHWYSTLNLSQTMTVINDIAESNGLKPQSQNGIYWIYNDWRKPINPRAPYIVVYYNAARVLDHNGEMINQHQLHSQYEAIEFEAGFKNPSEEWYKQNTTSRLGLPHVKAVEIHQDSINTDYTQLSDVKRLFHTWSQVIQYTWQGKLLDAGLNGI